MVIFRKLTSRLCVILFVLVAAFDSCNQPVAITEKSAVRAVETTIELNRNPSHIHYSKHAKCRMACRHIDETEIADILKKGSINYKKSQLKGEDCQNKYAVEGYSKDNQHLRIIFAPCGSSVTVVTCIDIGVEWACDCR